MRCRCVGRGLSDFALPTAMPRSSQRRCLPRLNLTYLVDSPDCSNAPAVRSDVSMRTANRRECPSRMSKRFRDTSARFDTESNQVPNTPIG